VRREVHSLEVLRPDVAVVAVHTQSPGVAPHRRDQVAFGDVLRENLEILELVGDLGVGPWGQDENQQERENETETLPREHRHPFSPWISPPEEAPASASRDG